MDEKKSVCLQEAWTQVGDFSLFSEIGTCWGNKKLLEVAIIYLGNLSSNNNSNQNGDDCCSSTDRPKRKLDKCHKSSTSHWHGLSRCVGYGRASWSSQQTHCWWSWEFSDCIDRSRLKASGGCVHRQEQPSYATQRRRLWGHFLESLNLSVMGNGLAKHTEAKMINPASDGCEDWPESCHWRRAVVQERCCMNHVHHHCSRDLLIQWIAIQVLRYGS